jgi:hypothetical protein
MGVVYEDSSYGYGAWWLDADWRMAARRLTLPRKRACRAAAGTAGSCHCRNTRTKQQPTPPPPDNTAGLAFNFIASFTRDGGSVPVVFTFKTFQGEPSQAVAKMVAGKQAAQNKLDAVFVSTNNLTFVAGACARACRAARSAALRPPVWPAKCTLCAFLLPAPSPQPHTHTRNSTHTHTHTHTRTQSSCGRRRQPT